MTKTILRRYQREKANKVGAAKIVYNKEECISCGLCSDIDPTDWSMEPGEKADLLDSIKVGDTYVKEVDDSRIEGKENNLEVAQGCPVNCIHIERNGKREI